MSEREKLEEAVAAHTSARAAAEDVDRRTAYAYVQQESVNLHEMREKLREIAAAFAPKVIVSVSEESASVGKWFRISIGDGRPLFRKPFAGLDVQVWGNGFSVFDRFEESKTGYPVDTGKFDTVEEVALVIRDAGAAYIASRGEYPRHRPEWLDALVFLNTGIVMLALFGLCVLIWGWNGVVYGGFAGWVSYYVVRAIGGWGLLITAGLAVFILR